ncbi:hypothetical protein [Synechococcus sp. MIT S9509]|uniref:hypothetical protein n=1 Tax=Synechococcus sp. MIT S9509 TaxID=1801630 RepID=UPI0012E8B685|nr:hypothetical protein [Synechococcus sp. MIT S9509]
MGRSLQTNAKHCRRSKPQAFGQGHSSTQPAPRQGLWNPVPVEIGTDIRCRDDREGSSREANLCPSWKDRLLALPKGLTDTPPEMLKEACWKPFDRTPTQEEHCCQQRTANSWISGSYDITALGLPKM